MGGYRGHAWAWGLDDYTIMVRGTIETGYKSPGWRVGAWLCLGKQGLTGMGGRGVGFFPPRNLEKVVQSA